LDEEGLNVRPEEKRNGKRRLSKDEIKFLKVRYKSTDTGVRSRKKALEC
jgi:hypothetical protein